MNQIDMHDFNRQINAPLCERWSSFLLMGIFLVILGTLALSSAFITTMATVLFFGILFIAAGIAALVHSFWTSEWKGFFSQLLVGILSIVVGWLMVSHPVVGAVSITLLLATFFIASGLFKISSALIMHDEQWGWALLSGVISLALGVLVFAQWPAASFWLLGLFLAIDLLVSGWTNIIFSFALRKRCSLERPKPLS